MQRKTSRRTFLSRSLMGLGTMASCTRAGWARAAHDSAVDRDPAIRTYRELYFPSPGPGIAPWLNPAYATNAGLAREEILTRSSRSDAYFDHVFVSEDDGPPQLLRYEAGADYDPQEPFRPEFLEHNQAYRGNAPAFALDGTVYFPVCIIRNQSVVLMRREGASGEWKASNHCVIDSRLSSRGLLEPEAAVLGDGRILIVCRGSNTSTTPGRKWRILSKDQGKTLDPVEVLTYEDSEPFYSPSSIHRFIRSRRNGLLYWLANITPEPPSGNSPRYPLYIAEIDETHAAVRRDSLIMLDTRRPGEPSRMQLSNFHVLQDRQSDDIEICITLLGLNPDDFWRSDVYRYIFSPPST